MPTKYTVQDGDCATSIAAKNGFATFHQVYDDPGNADLRKLRPNPNLLEAGDIVTIPDGTPKTLSLATGQRHKIVVKRPKAELRLHLRDLVGKKLGGAAFRLTLAGRAVSGTADADGLLKVPIPPNLVKASLEIDLPKPPPPPAAVSDGLVLPKETFTIPATKKDSTKDYRPPKMLIWTLSLGALGPPDVIRGAQRRLQNLGFPCAATDALDTRTTAALRAFQDTRKITISGTLDDATRADLTKAHDQGSA
jgi:Putative peptidoglycan binding domain